MRILVSVAIVLSLVTVMACWGKRELSADERRQAERNEVTAIANANGAIVMPPDIKEGFTIDLQRAVRGPVITDQGAADLSSRKNLVKNPDGSVDLYFGPVKPSGSNDNWVKTNPEKGWFAYFRFYGPTKAYFDKTWSLNDLEKVQ